MTIRLTLVAAALGTAALPTMATAQDAAPPQRIRNVLLQPGEKCPPSTGEEIVVCGAADPEQFRIPKALREEPAQTPESTSWAVKSDRVMQDQRRVLPGSCSPVGSNGHTGCAQAAAEAWSAEKRAEANGQSTEPPR